MPGFRSAAKKMTARAVRPPARGAPAAPAAAGLVPAGPVPAGPVPAGPVVAGMVAAGLGALLLAAAASGPARAETAITVFAASSLQDVVAQTAARHKAAGGGGTRLSFASSSTLARQIAAGAPADVFVSAHPKWITWLASRRKLAAPGGVVILSNRLAMIAPADKAAPTPLPLPLPLTAAGVTARLGGGRLAVGDPSHVPAGIYAKAAMQKLGLWTALAPRLARAANTRAALALVALGEAPLGIVYRSDAMAERRVKVVALLPADSHPRIVYMAAAVSGPRARAAAAFIRQLIADARAGRFRKLGFSPVDQ